jgi:signal transduction histidine kinase/FixJ family two-component response regulator
MSLDATGHAAGHRSRILLRVATRRDAEVTQRLLAHEQLESTVCGSLAQVASEIAAGAGALLLTEEALAAEEADRLIEVLDQQEEWSDLPIVVLITGGTGSPRAAAMLRRLTNVTVLERPAPIRSVLSAVQAAVRARRRQYQIRDQMEAVRSAEARAQELQQQLEAALHASDVGTFYVELPPRVLVSDDRCRGHLSLPPAGEVRLEQVFDAVHADDRERLRRALRDAWEGQVPLDVEFRVLPTSTATSHWIRLQGRVISPPGADQTRFVGTTQDVTPRRRMEDERLVLLRKERSARVEAERANRLKDEFLATLSHELRTPLNAIAGWAELLKEAADDEASVTEAAGAISRSVRVQAELIEDLLDVSRIISGKVRLELRTVRLPDVVLAAIETVTPSAQAKEVQLQTDLNPLPTLTGDPARLQQVVWNLLSNAVKFTPSGGRVCVGLQQRADTALLTVTDSGEGIAAEFLPRLFDRFSQADGSTSRRHGGLGLGLSIVRGLAEMHGGRVWATSPGRGLGATFSVELPLVSPVASSSPASPPAPVVPASETERPDLDGVSVLIVDDEPDAREVLRRLLGRAGARPHVAASAQEARELLKTEQPQVIVSDIGMPGTDGYQLIRELRWQKVTTPAIALTAFARSEDASRAQAAGYQVHLAKPVDPAQLLAHVARLAGSQRSRCRAMVD